jgi:hypothetical protein
MVSALGTVGSTAGLRISVVREAICVEVRLGLGDLRLGAENPRKTLSTFDSTVTPILDVLRIV